MAVYINLLKLTKRFNSIKRRWHIIRANYFEMLYKSCLEKEMRVKLQEKFSYHIYKLKNYEG
ncbi:hypothetical protein CYJ37_23885 [Bacillus sp. UMB0728]|nr:hypothetical protein CYJ37_23885 [Bacillus sp. UMB0728]